MAVVVVAAGAAIFILVAPAFLNIYWMRVLSNVFMFAALAQALNIIAGYTGYPAFGNVVFFGLGAYTVAVLMVRVGVSFWLGVAAGGAFSAAVALLVGPPMLRLRGHYFAIGTLGLNEAIRAVVDNLTGTTGGGQGLSLPLPEGSALANAIVFYFLFLGTMVLSTVVTALWARSRYGYASRAIGSNEEAAGSMGVDATVVKTLAWGVSAFLTGIVGAIYAYRIGYIEPAAVFDMDTAVKIFVVMLLGGAGTVFGPVLGALFIEIAATYSWSNFLEYHTLILGVIIITVAIWLPGGIVAFVRDRLARARVAFGGGRR
ncbi:MAG TPA: branched-chain amino acid ABC transporter permease [Actinomycetota bacterium]|nr:branched-chain amino acid ABC transporter permease [Actinomycetota bacterium]